MNRNRTIAGIVIGAVLLLGIAAGLWRWRSIDRQRPAGQRTLVTELGYCGPDEIKPCIVSFNLDSNGNMLVDVLTPTRTYPNFYLTISRETEEHRYQCQKVKGFLTSFVCTGQELFPGEVLQFRLVTVRDDKVLAAGRFAIIGLMIATPGVEATETATPTQTATPIPLEILTPLATTPATTAPWPSYPNPSYPNPSYPNP